MNALLRAIQDVTFETFLEAANIKMQNFAYTTLNEKLRNWITRMHYPVLKITRDYENGEATISQENINVLDSSLWWIPITYTTQKKHDFSRVLPTFWLKPQKNEVRLNETCKGDEWIIVNLQQAGKF
jgi:aminopeptidase N